MEHPRRQGRDISGMLLLDKHQDISSNEALQKVKRIFNANKAGHTGALDPLATGMLPICLGEATKFSQFLLDSDKRYRVIARLGQRTDTSDAQGTIISEKVPCFTSTQLNEALDQFRGNILQIPSMYSALKHHGKPLYEYARQGIEIVRSARPVSIYELQLIRWEGHELELEISCSKGTYIRTIIDDLGELLGCGAHVTALRRLQVASYLAEQMCTLEQLHALLGAAQAECPSDGHKILDSLLLPLDSGLQNFPEVNLTTAVADSLRQGKAVQASGTPATGMVRITAGDTRDFIGIGIIDDNGLVAPRRLIANS